MPYCLTPLLSCILHVKFDDQLMIRRPGVILKQIFLVCMGVGHLDSI